MTFQDADCSYNQSVKLEYCKDNLLVPVCVEVLGGAVVPDAVVLPSETMVTIVSTTLALHNLIPFGASL